MFPPIPYSLHGFFLSFFWGALCWGCKVEEQKYYPLFSIKWKESIHNAMDIFVLDQEIKALQAPQGKYEAI